MMGSLASSPGMLASEKSFAQSAEQLSGAVQSVAKILKDHGVPQVVATMVAAPLCAASWQLQVEQQKTPHAGAQPSIDVQRIADVAVQFNEAMGDDAEFPVRQLPHISRMLIEDPSAPALFGTNFRETLRGMSGVFSAESANPENADKAGIDEAHEYFLARLSAFSPERIGEALHAAREYMNPTDRKGKPGTNPVTGWHTLAFWGNTAKDERAKEMLSLALATQIAIGDDWYDAVQRKNPELCKILVKMTRQENTGLVAKAAKEYADRVEFGAHMDLGETEKLSSVMCTAMREGMTVFHAARANIFTATQLMLEKKYPEAKTEQAIREAMEKEQWGIRVKSAYQAAKTLREGIFSGIRENVGATELSVSMKIRAAVGAAVAPLLKPSNAQILAAAFPCIPKEATPESACLTVVDWGEKAVREMAGATVAAIDIPNLDHPKMQGRIEKVLQEVLERTDVVSRCAKQGKSADIFPEMVKELRTVIQTTAGMLPATVREHCVEPLQASLLNADRQLCETFRAAAEQREEPEVGMENEAARQAQNHQTSDAVSARENAA
ncbi:MAG: hypothetical protein ACYCQL_02880 [Acidithiobacillus sp.]